MKQEDINNYYRKRRAEDPTFRQKTREACKRYRESIKRRIEEDPEWGRAYLEETRRKARERYHKKKAQKSDE
jgi:hypothetical protein